MNVYDLPVFLSLPCIRGPKAIYPLSSPVALPHPHWVQVVILRVLSGGETLVSLGEMPKARRAAGSGAWLCEDAGSGVI